jgi:hypothetical protein
MSSRRQLVGLACAWVAVGAAAGCGTADRNRASGQQPASGLSAAVVARVGRWTITETELEHWMAVEATIEWEPRPTRPMPAGVIPTPPGYQACVGYAIAQARAQHTPPSPVSELKAACQARHRALQRLALGMLITDYWIQEEARKASVAVTPAEVLRAVHRQYPAATLDQYLALTKLHEDDLTFLFAGPLLLSKVRFAVLPVYKQLRSPKTGESPALVEEVDNELQKFAVALPRTWKPRTDCKPAYAIRLCGGHIQ